MLPRLGEQDTVVENDAVLLTVLVTDLVFDCDDVRD